MRSCIVFMLFILSLCMHREQVYAQSETAYSEEAAWALQAGETYLDGKIQSLEKYLSQSARIYRRLQKKLERKERKLLKQMDSDSLAAVRGYQPGLPVLDSTTNIRSKAVSIVDSLKGVQQFINKQAGLLEGAPAALPGSVYTDKLDQLQKRLQLQQQLQSALQEKTKALAGLAGSKLKGLRGLQKDIYYAREQIGYWKEVASEPDKVEEKALEYLMGTEGFFQMLPDRNAGAFGGLGKDATPEALARMGYQTKAQVGKLMQERFGDQLGNIQQQMGEQLQQYQKQLEDVQGKVQEAKSAYTDGQAALTDVKRTKNELKKLSFHKNPQRGKPFWQRFSTEYNWQTTRAFEQRPAMLDLGVSVAYKSSPKFRIGAGIAGSLGLGRDWQHLKITPEGLALRAFLDRELLFGISIQGGYERHFRPLNRPYLNPVSDGGPEQADNLLRDAFGGQQQVAYIGLMKRYRINSKWNGTFLIGYNLLWNEYDLRTPLLIRLGWEK